jgi:hypothetical protein
MAVATEIRTDAEIQSDVLAERKWEPRVQANAREPPPQSLRPGAHRAPQDDFAALDVDGKAFGVEFSRADERLLDLAFEV